jgi:hypothetical protein
MSNIGAIASVTVDGSVMGGSGTASASITTGGDLSSVSAMEGAPERSTSAN